MESPSKKTMQIIELEEFFQLIKYDFEQDLKNIEEICKLTKTRPRILLKISLWIMDLNNPF